jgi:predicted metal-binding protein
MSKQLGTDDSVNTCDCCGKTGLKFTFAVELDSGEVVHYGSTCVTRHTGKTPAKIASEIAAHEAAEKAIKEKMFRATAEYAAYQAKWNEASKLGLIGKQFKAFLVESGVLVAHDAKRAEIFA